MNSARPPLQISCVHPAQTIQSSPLDTHLRDGEVEGGEDLVQLLTLGLTLHKVGVVGILGCHKRPVPREDDAPFRSRSTNQRPLEQTAMLDGLILLDLDSYSALYT